jgi:putative transposase
VVDGRDTTITRKALLSISPSPRQERELHACLDATREVYNAALQHRRDTWDHAKRWHWQTPEAMKELGRVGLFDQFTELTGIREVRPDLFAWGLQPVRGALRRLDEAYTAFFKRVKNGDTPGHPRFKGWGRFNTIMWDEPSGWKLDLDRRTVRVMGVGDIRLPKGSVRQLRRLEARGGVPRTLTVTRRRAGGTKTRPRWVWRATVGFRGVTVETSTPTAGVDSLVGADRGIKVTLATAQATLDDAVAELHRMPRWMAEARDRIILLQASRSGRTKYSRSWRQANRAVAREHRKVAAQADNWAREVAGRLVAHHGVIVVENLDLASMTRSAKGTVEEPGKNVSAKQGLNRSLQDAALGRLAKWICVKAESAGRRVWLVPAPNTSRRCFSCGHIAKANRPFQAEFACTSCGHQANADVNAARNIARLGHQAEQAWAAAGTPSLTRPKPRLRRRKTDNDDGLAAAA